MSDPVNPINAQTIVGRFLNFDTMIGGSLIKIIYYAGLVGVAVYALVILMGGIAAASYSPMMGLLGFLGAAAMLVIGTIMWRFTCELWILLFRIHDRLGEIKDRLPPTP